MNKFDRIFDACLGFLALVYIGALKFIFWFVVIPIGVYDGSIVIRGDRRSDALGVFFACLVVVGFYAIGLTQGEWPRGVYMPTIMYCLMGALLWLVIAEQKQRREQARGMPGPTCS